MPLYGQPTHKVTAKYEIDGITSSGASGAAASYSPAFDISEAGHRFIGVLIHKLSLGTETSVRIGLQVSADRNQWFNYFHTSDSDITDPAVYTLILTSASEVNPSVSPDVTTETGSFYPLATFFGVEPLSAMLPFARLKIWSTGGSPGGDSEIEYQIVTF